MVGAPLRHLALLCAGVPICAGYGMNDTATNVSFGGNPAKRYITTYFRKSVSVPKEADYE